MSLLLERLFLKNLSVIINVECVFVLYAYKSSTTSLIAFTSTETDI